MHISDKVNILPELAFTAYQLSLVIATYQDEGDLVFCLQSLLVIKAPFRFEVIIVDQNQDNRVKLQLIQFSALNLRHIKVDFIGANRARNIGASVASGSWLSFPDDDIVFTKDSLLHFSRCLSRVDLSLVSGKTVTAEGEPNVLRWHDKPRLFNRWTMFNCLSEATIFINKAVFNDVGGFDERFGPGALFPAAEGIDLINRVFKHDPRLVAYYEPNIKLIHPSKVPPWNEWAVARMSSYGVGDGAMVAKNLNANILWWAFVTIAAACLNLLAKDRYKRKAFAARLCGMMRGFVLYLKDYRF